PFDTKKSAIKCFVGDITLKNSSALLVAVGLLRLNLNYEKHLTAWQPHLVLNLAACKALSAVVLPNVTELLAPAAAVCDAAAAGPASAAAPPRVVSMESGGQEEALAATVAELGWRRVLLVFDKSNDGLAGGGSLRLLAALGRRAPDAAVVAAEFDDISAIMSELSIASVRFDGFVLAIAALTGWTLPWLSLEPPCPQLCGRSLLVWSPPAASPPGNCRFCYFSPSLSTTAFTPMRRGAKWRQLSLRQADLLSGLPPPPGCPPAEEIRSAIFSGSRRQQLLCRSGSGSDGFIQSGEFVEDSGKFRLSRFLVTRDKNGFELNVTGLSIDMINEVASRLKFRAIACDNRRTTLGRAYSNGTWNGMVGDVLRKRIISDFALTIAAREADFAIGPFTMTAIRQTVIDFSVPFMQDGNAILIKKPEQENPMFRVLSPFSLYSWLAILGSMLLSSFCIFVYSRLSRSPAGT
uniref:Lig_chan-Glu_bd domain-containing protein n=1 Tax=Macrostomum lignano TaxID=282301 RepID=A0A1I8F6B0_9PLAT